MVYGTGRIHCNVMDFNAVVYFLIEQVNTKSVIYCQFWTSNILKLLNRQYKPAPAYN
jgi:hypothetical protein